MLTILLEKEKGGSGVTRVYEYRAQATCQYWNHEDSFRAETRVRLLPEMLLQAKREQGRNAAS